ncbi:MAG: flagellar hook-basal body protein [Tissierella sp.]|uniref:flagellar hook-basal body protein n=1 Tax=Tissierella sp. TaxID=41274 RepID=UPI003F9B6433
MYNVLSLNKTGIKAHQRKMDGIAHNLANVNTHGYKRKEVNFEELRLREVEGDVLKSDKAEDFALNMGSKAGYTKTTFNQGTITPSSEKFSMAIGGEGFFGVRDGNGNLLLTRNGSFYQDADGSVLDESGNYLDMEIYQPFESWNGNINIAKNGQISKIENGQEINLGRVVLYKPDNPDNLLPLDGGKYLLKEGAELYTSFEDEDFGSINQYFLEESNADLSKSMVDMISTQRVYSMNAKALQTTDEIMTMINGIKR